MKKTVTFNRGPRISLRTGVLMVALVGMAVFLFILLISPREEENAFSNPPASSSSPQNVEPVLGQSSGEDRAADSPSSSAGMITAHVVGAVAQPGIVMLHEGSRVFEAVAEAGGFTKHAAPEALNLAEAVVDGAQIRIPTKAEAKNGPVEPPGQLPAQPEKQAANDRGSTDGSTKTKVNVNTADSATLQQLSGVGPATAAKIIEHREQFGMFSDPEELTAVRGIGPATVEKIRDQLSF